MVHRIFKTGQQVLIILWVLDEKKNFFEPPYATHNNKWDF